MKVSDEFRTHYLSFVPGGTTVRVVMKSGKVYDYDKVKSPRKYIDKIEDKSNIQSIFIAGVEVWRNPK
jgi:hypothetical protein